MGVRTPLLRHRRSVLRTRTPLSPHRHYRRPYRNTTRSLTDQRTAENSRMDIAVFAAQRHKPSVAVRRRVTHPRGGYVQLNDETMRRHDGQHRLGYRPQADENAGYRNVYEWLHAAPPEAGMNTGCGDDV